MQLLPKTMSESLDLVYNILNQGDTRYNNPETEHILARLIQNKSISLEEKDLPNINLPQERLNEKVQSMEKYIAKFLLLHEGFKEKEIFFERKFRNSRPDVIGESTNKRILVECCSCRVDKIIDYLREANEVWVLTRGFLPWETPPNPKDKMQLFIFKKGESWVGLDFNNQEKERVNSIKNPLDF